MHGVGCVCRGLLVPCVVFPTMLIICVDVPGQVQRQQKQQHLAKPSILHYATSTATYPLLSHTLHPPHTGHILKEAIEDLEWPGGNVTMHLTNTPPGALLSARGPNGTLQVKLPLGGTSRTQMRLHGQEVQHSYSYRHLATALGNVGREQQQHVTSKVGGWC